MKPRIVLVLAVVVVGASAAALSGSAGAEGSHTFGYFRTPSGSVYCDYLYGSGVVAKYRYVRCGFNGRLVPRESKPKGGCPKDTGFDGNRMEVSEKGRGQTQPCGGDAGPFGNTQAAVPVRYGHTWHGGAFSCKAFKQGMTCTSTDGHGFRIEKRHWRVF